MRIRELRAKAREDAQGNIMKIVIPVFIVMLASYLIGLIPTFISDETSKAIASIITSIISVLIVIPLSYALIIRTIKIARKEKLSSFVNDVFDEGIRNGFSCAWGIFKKIWYWLLILIVSDVLIIVGSAMVIENSFSTVGMYLGNSSTNVGGIALSFVFIVVGFVLLILSVIKFIIAQYNYFLVQYLKHDYPEKPTSELLEKSKEMMDGNKAKAFVIPLTFIGWALLSVLCMFVIIIVFGIGYGILNYNLIASGITPAIPVWMNILLYAICYFIFSFVTSYMLMTNTEFYFERKPLEIYNEDYVKPETNAKKYKSIIGWVCGAILIVYLLSIALGVIIYDRASRVANDAAYQIDHMYNFTD